MDYLRIGTYAGTAIAGIAVGFFGKSLLDKAKAKKAAAEAEASRQRSQN